jgi:hypothetical protein
MYNKQIELGLVSMHTASSEIPIVYLDGSII